MDFIRSVPTEIIRDIIAAAGVNDRITVAIWKKSLSFLWVCREWRIVAEPMLLSTLICENELDDEVDTNCVFLLQRRCFDRVKRIILREESDRPGEDEGRYHLNVGILKCFGELLDDKDMEDVMESLEIIKNDGVIVEERRELQCDYYKLNDSSDDSSDDSDADYEDSDKYMTHEYYTTEYYDRRDYDFDELYDMCESVSPKVVSRFVLLLPNITHLILNFDSEYWPMASHCLADILISNYAKQLVKLECNMPEIDYRLNDGHNIQSIILKKYDFNSRQLLRLPPHKVKNVSLEFDGKFSWSLFKCSDSLPVSYDNLTRLDIGGDDNTADCIIDDLDSLRRSAEKPPLVVFPKLRVLSIRNRILSNSSLKYLLQFPVKLLCAEGSIYQLYQIYEQNLENLDQLVLNLRFAHLDDNNGFYYYNEVNENGRNDGFVQLSNKLFAKTFNIAEVHCTLALQNLVMDWTDINWAYLTHLYVNVDSLAGQIIEAIPKFLNLLYLEVTVYSSIDHASNSLIESITNLKRNCAEPISSNITCVVVKGYYNCYDIRIPELMEALEFLKWYLPKLNSLELINTREN